MTDLENIAERFWPLVDKAGDSDCWIWSGRLDAHGYGAISVRGKALKAHRVAVMLTTGEMPPPERFVMHTCDNPPCVNPAHLVLGSNLDNIADRTRKGRSARNRPQGEKHGMHRYSADFVRSIKRGEVTLAQAMERGMSFANFYAIKRGDLWKCLE